MIDANELKTIALRLAVELAREEFDTVRKAKAIEAKSIVAEAGILYGFLKE